jgi:hypothetical protein
MFVSSLLDQLLKIACARSVRILAAPKEAYRHLEIASRSHTLTRLRPISLLIFSRKAFWYIRATTYEMGSCAQIGLAWASSDILRIIREVIESPLDRTSVTSCNSSAHPLLGFFPIAQDAAHLIL